MHIEGIPGVPVIPFLQTETVQGCQVLEHSVTVSGGSALTGFSSISAGGMTWKNQDREPAQFKHVILYILWLL